MALTIHDQELNTVKEEKKQLELDNSRLRQLGLMIASQRINQPGESGPYQDKTTYPKETEGQKLEKSGQYLKDPETEVDTSQPLESRMFDIDPKKHRDKRRTERIHKKSTDPQAQGSEKDWVKKTGPQLPKLNIKPQDLLKILQLLPALTGGGLGQMADSRRRDLMIRQAVGAYGKHPKTGEYIDPAKLLQSLPRA